MKKISLAALAVFVLIFVIMSAVQAQSPMEKYSWILGRWSAEMKVYVQSDNFTYTNSNCGGGDHVEFLRSGDIIEAYCRGDRTKPYGLRVIISGGSIEWQRLGRTTGPSTADPENNIWRRVSVSVSNNQRMVTSTFPGWQDMVQDRTITITLTKE